MKRILFILIPLLLFCSISRLHAQTIKFRSIGTDQGLSVGFVQCVIQDSKGFMWFGTQDGLNKYDGYEMKVFRNNPKDKSSLSNNDILTIYEDKSGTLWIGTNGGGLEEYDPALNKFKHHQNAPGNNNSLPNNIVRCIYEDKQFNLWIGTEYGLARYDRKTEKFVNYHYDEKNKNSLSGNSVYAITESGNGMLWIGTQDGGLSSFVPNLNQFQFYDVPPEFLYKGKMEYMNQYRKRINSLFPLADGTMLVGTGGGGLGVFDLKTSKYNSFTMFVSADSPEIIAENNRIWSIAKSRSDEVWIAAFGGGLIQYDIKTGNYVLHQKQKDDITSLNSNDVYNVFVDSEDNVWCGTQNGGVNVFFRYSAKFRHYETSGHSEIPLANKFIFAILQDRNGLVWLGTDGGGVISLDLKKNVSVPRNEIINNGKDKWVLSLLEDADGDIWAGTYGSGLYHYNSKSAKTESLLDNDPAFATILCLYESKNGDIWIGTFGGGLFNYNKYAKSLTRYTSENGLPNDVVYSVFEDSKNNLWIGTEGGGACMKKVSDMNTASKAFTYFAKKDPQHTLSSDKVFCFYEDKAQNIWIGTSNGLNKVENSSGNILSYHESEGLPNGNIYGIVPDAKGNLWMTTNKGLSRFNPNVENIEGSAFKNFDLKDGLQGMEFNQGAYYKAKNGDIFIGGENGLNIFNPSNIKDNPHVPPVYITSYKRFGKEVLFDSTITDKRFIELDYRDNSLSLDFVALDYLMPSENKFQYMLEGVDEKWSVPSTFRHATYTQLDGGEYVLKIKASNSDGIWNETPLEIHIRVNPPWWKTKWFYTLSVILITAGVFGFIRYRTAAIKKENRILENKVAERTHELNQKNQDILSSIQYAKRIQEAILPPRSSIFSKLPDMFILYKPKDIVSGDFYWFAEKGGLKIFATVDCTGHGVPGAFMSMIGHNLINQIVNERGVIDPGYILTQLHLGVQAALKQGVSEEVRTADGMDVAVVSINTETREVKYAGANRSLVIINASGELDKIDANKFPIGGSQLDMDRVFTTHSKTLNKRDTIYMSTDGYADQFGGEKGKKYMVKRFHEYLCSIQEFPMQTQGDLLGENIENWRGDYEQVDDILLVGIRF
ncbi:MAG: rsbU 6 [Bacteroidetes bacterium]|jgi:ligand-binding sensor domain-containing protein/serine phosphatase RsbU (regulator of sigma subunit)|nr:rsbU 6 [Bacteroidota bacterium]